MMKTPAAIWLLLGVLVLCSSVLALYAPGDYIDIFLVAMVCFAVSAACSPTKRLKVIAVLLIALVAVLAHLDHERGRFFKMKQFQEMLAAPTTSR